MPIANSRVAKNINIPATTIAAVLKFARNKPTITSVITNPIRAAKILGAFAIGFSFKLSAFDKR